MRSNHTPNNPAGRLAMILNNLRQVKNKALGDAWVEVLGVDKKDTGELIQRVALVSRLVDDTEAQIKSQKDLNHGLYLRWTPLVREVFTNLNFRASVNDVNGRLTPEAMTGLEFCDEILSRSCPERTLDPQKLAEVIQEVKSLIDQVIASELPNDLKEFVLDKLDLLLRALEMYQVAGIGPIATALDTIIGTTARCGGKPYAQSKDTPLGKKFWSLCGKVATMIALADGGKKLLECLTTFLQT